MVDIAKTFLFILGISISGFVSSNDIPVLSLESMKKEILPTIRLGADWSIEKAREHSDILAKLPSSFDEWQNTYINVPVKFVLVDDNFDVSIERTHTFTIAPDNGFIRGITVEIAPVFRNDLEAALEEADKWNAFFTGLQLPIGVNSRSYDSNNFSREEAIERFEYSKSKGYRQYGTGLNIWKSEKAYYSLGIEQYLLSSQVVGEQSKEVIYKVIINCWRE
jgi:hypothetical protein